MASDLLSLIGNTPLVELRACSPRPGLRLFAKLEGQNPSGSVKDRIVSYMVGRARADGRLKPGQEIVEATTGNTGLALAMVGRRLGHRVRVIVPGNTYGELTRALEAWGAKVEMVPAALGIASAIEAARDIARRDSSFLLGQFESPDNPRCHYETTAAEILSQCPEINVFVCGLGTGGTAMGVGKRLKEQDPAIQVVVAEPHPGHRLQGMRNFEDGYVPPILDRRGIDGKILVTTNNAIRAMRELMTREGILAGFSSGAVLYAALKWAQKIEAGNIVLLFADSGWKYLNSPAFSHEEPRPDDEDLEDTLWW
jgi:[CysO sulfur-carrier protein]-thiocarboxylate-dependent cysteine synthase